jgi:hypothetical protein
MIKWSEFVDLAPTHPGEVVRVSHESEHCTGDSKSLRIERKGDGTITAHCFRCGESGSYNPGATRRVTTEVEPKKVSVYNLGALEYDPFEWPVKASAWLYKYGITNEEITSNKIAWSAVQRRVVLPITWNSENTGYQLRHIYDDDTGPKYITVQQHKTPSMSIKGLNDGIVICEDILSTIKVSRVQRAMALLSTNIMSGHLADVVETYDKFWVWLDMDNSQVIRGALKLMKTLELFGSVKLLRTGSDPKTYNEMEIKRLLYGT